MEKNFLKAIEARRSFYAIGKEFVVSDERIEELIGNAVKHAPSPFNSQSARVILLIGEQHNKLWDIAKEALKKVVPAANFAATEEKIDSFKNGYGSVLFFEDVTVVESLQQGFPTYKDNFPIWSQQSSGMLQYIVWTALELEGFGASLQHYSPLIDSAIQSTWSVPSAWKLIAQMPFGKPAAAPQDKTFQPLEERMKVYKS